MGASIRFAANLPGSADGEVLTTDADTALLDKAHGIQPRLGA